MNATNKAALFAGTVLLGVVAVGLLTHVSASTREYEAPAEARMRRAPVTLREHPSERQTRDDAASNRGFSSR